MASRENRHVIFVIEGNPAMAEEILDRVAALGFDHRLAATLAHCNVANGDRAGGRVERSVALVAFVTSVSARLLPRRHRSSPFPRDARIGAG